MGVLLDRDLGGALGASVATARRVAKSALEAAREPDTLADARYDKPQCGNRLA
jgi:hypothetical protein